MSKPQNEPPRTDAVPPEDEVPEALPVDAGENVRDAREDAPEAADASRRGEDHPSREPEQTSAASGEGPMGTEAPIPADVGDPRDAADPEDEGKAAPGADTPAAPETPETPEAEAVGEAAEVSDAGETPGRPGAPDAGAAADASQGSQGSPEPDGAEVPEGAGETAKDAEAPKPARSPRKARPKREFSPVPPERLEGAVEALLLASGDVLSVDRLRDLLGLTSVVHVREAIDAIAQRWTGSGLAVEIQEVAGGLRVSTRPEYAEYVRRLSRRPEVDKLSPSLLETLSIVAYRQPVPRVEVERIRGVQCGDALRGLLERRLLKVAGRSDQPGRPLLYGTTKRFLEVFGLRSLQELPAKGDLKRM